MNVLDLIQVAGQFESALLAPRGFRNLPLEHRIRVLGAYVALEQGNDEVPYSDAKRLFDEAYRDTRHVIEEVGRVAAARADTVQCAACGGVGQGAGWAPCSACNGEGKVTP